MDPSDSPKKVTRLRTFQSDAQHARAGMVQSTPQPAIEKIIPKTETVPAPSAPVLPIVKAEKEIPTMVQDKAVPPIPKKPPVAPAAPKTLPTNQTLSNEISLVSKTHKTSILSDDNDYEGGSLEGGTIIRDTQRKRFRLIPAIIASVRSWLADTKGAYEESLKPKHTVAKAEARVAVIQKATLQSGQAPKTDFKKVAEHLKTVERKPVASVLTFKEKSEVQPPTWEHKVEEDAVQETDRESAAVQAAEQLSGFTAEEIEEALAAAPQETEAAESQPQEVATQAEETEASISTEILPPQEIFGEEQVEQLSGFTAEEIERSEAVTAYEEQEAEPAAAPMNQPQRYAVARTQPVSFPIRLLIAVIAIASFSGIGISYYFFAGTAEKAPQQLTPEVYVIPQLIDAQMEVPIKLQDGRAALLESIRAAIAPNTSVTQVYPTIPTESGQDMPAPASSILEKIAFRTPGSFTRGVKEIAFGGTENSDPFIIFKITSFDAAFAGMLQWENTMSADLSPLFGAPVVETFDPQARTATQIRGAFFKDTIASNKNIRLLLDENGDDRVVYTFIDQNTILITTTREALHTLVPLVQ